MANCRAQDPTKCRVHGVSSHLNTMLNENRNLTASDQFRLRELVERAEKPEPESKALGVAVYYDDGTFEVFTGSATDPYYSTDYSFYSVETGESIEGLNYNKGDTADTDYLEKGPRKVADYQKQLNDSEGFYLLLRSDDGGYSHPSDKRVSQAVVL